MVTETGAKDEEGGERHGASEGSQSRLLLHGSVTTDNRCYTFQKVTGRYCENFYHKDIRNI